MRKHKWRNERMQANGWRVTAKGYFCLVYKKGESATIVLPRLNNQGNIFRSQMSKKRASLVLIRCVKGCYYMYDQNMSVGVKVNFMIKVSGYTFSVFDFFNRRISKAGVKT